MTEKKERTRDFSSTHLLLSHELAQSVIHWGREEIPEEDLFQDTQDPDFGRENEPHVTVLFGILDTNPDKFRYFFSTQKPIPIKLGRISTFANEKFDVVKIEVTSPALRELNAEMREKFPHHQAFPSYRPHVTIAYLKPGKGKRLSGNDFFVGQKFRAPEVVFSSRDGTKTTMPLGKRKKST